MKALVVILKEAALQLKNTVLNLSLIIFPYQVLSSVSDTWYYNRSSLSCTSYDFYSEMNWNKWVQVTSLYRKNLHDIKLQLCGHWSMFRDIFSVTWAIFVCTHCLSCFWIVCVGKEDRCPDSNAVVRASTSCRQPEETPSDGERMTAELKDIVCQFMQKVSVKMHQRRNLYTNRSFCHPSTNQVDGFKQSVSRMSVSTTEQQSVSSFKSCLWLRAKYSFLHWWRWM